MKLKSYLKAIVMALFAVTFFTACEPSVGSKEKEEYYLYGNCTDPINNRADGRFGMNDSYTMATVTLLSGSELAAHGTHIVGVRALIDGSVTDAEVFVSADKDIENVLARKQFTWKDEGWQYVLFDEPVAITGDSLYVGYKITSSGYVIGLEPANKMLSSEFMWWNNQWFNLSEMGIKGYWSIQAILKGGDYSSETQYAISLDKVSAPEATRANDSFKVIAEVRNAGVCNISNLELVSVIGENESVAEVSRVLRNGESAKLEIMVPVGDVTGTIDFSLKVRVKGQDVESEVYNSTLNVYAGLKRNAILIEQFTGQTCRNCPEGAYAIKRAIAELANPDQVCWVAHHTYVLEVGDNFTIPGTMDVAYALNVNAAPQCNINRKVTKYDSDSDEALIWHPGYITSALLSSLIPTPADATMELTREFNVETRELKVVVKGNSLKEIAYITVLVNQDNMLADQVGASGDYYHTSPRAFLTKSTGDQLVLDAEGNYLVEYTYTIPEKVGEFDCVLEDMEVVAYVHGDINDKNNRDVYNADKIDILNK
jgi:hypothetical protein